MLSVAPFVPQLGWCWLPPTALMRSGYSVGSFFFLEGQSFNPTFYSTFVCWRTVSGAPATESARSSHTQPDPTGLWPEGALPGEQDQLSGCALQGFSRVPLGSLGR